MSRTDSLKIVFFVLLFPISLLLGWELLIYASRDYIFILPAPSQVIVRLWEKSDRFLFHTRITLSEMLLGFSLAFLMAFPLARIMDLYKSAGMILQPFFIVIQCIPMFTLAPIMIIWFGWSSAAIIFPTALMIFFPLTINIYQGLRSTSQDLLDFFKINQATSRQIFYKLKLPGALPYIFSGFRLSTAIAGIAAVAGEWAGAQSGLGILMLESRRDTDLETNFAALFCLTAISCLFYSIAVVAEYLAINRRSIINYINIFLKISSLKSGLRILAVIGVFLIVPSIFRYPLSEIRQVRLTLDWLPNPNHIPLYTGIKKGFFNEEGINLTIRKLQDSGNAVSYLTSGQSDLALNYMPNTIRIIRKGANVVPIGILIQEPLNAVIYRKDSSIVSPPDLTGKKMGYSTCGKDCLFLNTFLSQSNILPLEKRNVGFDLISSLGNRLVHAVYGAYWNIEPEHLRSLGIETGFFKLKEFGVPHYYELIVLANKDSDSAQPEFVAKFQKALQKSIDYSRVNPEEAFDIYMEIQQDKTEKTREWERKAWNLTLSGLADRQSISKEVWDNFEEWLKTHQLL